ncbi:helix-turn-helix domain-containing protein [Thalassotalea atypica]|uniref:helix-turn-helix domain-containing protein n=1 Tax=Thalassotalea atypica TaxID=2054316 RepID=UPI0025724BC6|nr:helix-turn-helix domain-containing protein [Thalassotalea atypica]
MTLGEQIKQLRQAKNLSQPELSELASIEQSYLSKLENDKSIPSNEIFRRLLSALNINLDDFLALFEQSEIKSTLKQIADVDNWLTQKAQIDFKKRRHYLLTSCVFIVIAVTLFFTGFTKLLFSETKYIYRSEGVVLDGEPKDIFQNWIRLMPRAEAHTVRENKRLEMEKRKDVDVIVMDDWRGETLSKPTERGVRYYQFYKEEKVKQSINAWLQVIAVFLFSCGIMGFVLERKLFGRT